MGKTIKKKKKKKEFGWPVDYFTGRIKNAAAYSTGSA